MGKLGEVFGKLRVQAAPYCTAVVAAAGSSSRMGGEDKLFAELRGEPVLSYTLRVLQDSPYINEIVVVTREESIVRIADLCAAYGIDKATKIVCGGEERLDSVLIGVTEASKKAGLIAVQDGARPLLTGDIIQHAVEKAARLGAAVPAVPVTDTIKVEKDGYVEATPERRTLRAVQTPQVFNAELLKGALTSAKQKGLAVTDDASCVEEMGGRVYFTEGSPDNIKITTPFDLVIAEAILERRRG